MSFAFDTNLTGEEAEGGDHMQRYLIWSEEGANGEECFVSEKRDLGIAAPEECNFVTYDTFTKETPKSFLGDGLKF